VTAACASTVFNLFETSPPHHMIPLVRISTCQSSCQSSVTFCPRCFSSCLSLADGRCMRMRPWLVGSQFCYTKAYYSETPQLTAKSCEKTQPSDKRMLVMKSPRVVGGSPSCCELNVRHHHVEGCSEARLLNSGPQEITYRNCRVIHIFLRSDSLCFKSSRIPEANQ
jgi:hypothetical protein